MKDAFGRHIEYLRLSVTDRCNLRCRYCMPFTGIDCVSHEDVLRYEEYLHLLRLLTTLGIRHVRITGGEPLVRRGIVDFIGALSKLDGIDSVTMTTNGILLADTAHALKQAGLSSVNMLYIIIATEEVFGIRFDDLGVGAFRTVGDVVDYIEGKLA